MSLPTVTVAGTIEAPDGTNLDGKTVAFRTTAEMVDAAGNVLVPILTVRGKVVAGALKAWDGTSALVLFASNTGTTTVPYEITESWSTRKFTVNLLTTDQTGSPLHIPYSTLGPVSPAPTATSPYVQSVVAGTNVTVDSTDPRNPVVSSTGGGGGGSSLPADAAGWLHDNGTGTLAWTTPTAAQVGADPAGTGATEAARATSAENALSSAITTEAGTRATADTTNANAIAAEASTARAAEAAKVAKAGDTMSGDLAMGSHRVTGLADPSANQDAATKAWTSAQITALVNGAPGILDTLGEIATALQADESTAATLATTVAGKLAIAQNLGDLNNAATARTNLGVPAGSGTSTGTNTGDQTLPTTLPPNGAAGGDLSGTYPNPGVAKVNGTSLAGLGTGLLKNTTGTGVPSIAVAADIPNIAESQVTNLTTDLANRVVQLPAPSGGDDLATLNALLAGGGVFRGKPGATYLISGPLVVPSNTTLDMTGCTIGFTTTSIHTNMLQNAAVTPVATATDAATTVGSSVVTSTALAAVAVVGQSLAVVGAGPPGGDGGGAIWMYGTVSAVNTGAHTITLSGNINGVAATSALTGATAYLFNRDSNIRIVGGTWDFGANWNTQSDRITAGFNSHQIRLRRLDGFTVRDVTLKGNVWSGGLGWTFGINPGDCTDFTIDNCRGVQASTVVQVDGPCARGFIKNIRGVTQDDQVALGCVGFQGNDVEGDVTDIEIDGVISTGSWHALRLFAGQGGNGVQRVMSNISARSIKGSTVGTGSPINLSDYTGAGAGPINVLLDDITVTPPAGQQVVANTATYGYVTTRTNALFTAADSGLLASTVDPADIAGTFQPSGGFIYLHQIKVPQTTTVANLRVFITASGATLTASQCWAGIYDVKGNLWAQTAQQATNWATLTGVVTMALTAQSTFSLNLPGGPGTFYWLALLSNGTTQPTFAAKVSTQGLHNAGFGTPYAATVGSGAKHRIGYTATGSRTTLISLAGVSVTDNNYKSLPWIGVT